MLYGQDAGSTPQYGGPGTVTVPPPGGGTGGGGGGGGGGTITLSPGSGGYTPDYTSLLQNDPGYLAAQAAAKLAEQQAAQSRRASIEQAIIRYGGALPSGFKDTYGDVDQATLDAARQNQNSTLAQLKNNYDQSVMNFQRALAARGALQSGDLNYGYDQLTRGEQQQEYDAGNQLLDQLGGYVNNYAGVLSSNASNLAQALMSAESNVYSNPAYRPVAATPATTANYDASSSALYGQPIYTGSDGTLYTADGNPFSLPKPKTNQSGGYVPNGFQGFDNNGNWIGF
jgi:hypothetical protein